LTRQEFINANCSWQRSGKARSLSETEQSGLSFLTYDKTREKVMPRKIDQVHYSMVIQWSDEDQAHVVSFPEWEAHGLIGHTHGNTFAEAVSNGQDVLQMLIESAQAEGESLPVPRTFVGTVRAG
jgi:predicted RNase H-like HicB family nuclease